MIYGIDVSKHQGTIDWNKVKAAGKDFAMIRLGWAGYDGKIVANGGLDPMFKTNVAGAKAAGLDVGIYVYSYCKTASAAKTAARETIELIKDYEITYPVAFDIEDAVNVNMTKAENTAISAAFLSAIETAGYYSMLYTYKSFALYNLNMSDLSRYDFWLAHYATSSDYIGNYGMWQYAGDTGTCPGVSTACDLNVAYYDYAQIIRAAGLNGLTADGTVDDVDEAGCCDQMRNALERIRDIADGALQ